MQFLFCGSTGPDPELNPYRVCNPPPRQAILRTINARPLGAEGVAVQVGLPAGEVRRHLGALERAGLVRQVGAAYQPTFPIFTRGDLEALTPWMTGSAAAFAEVVRQHMDLVARTHDRCRFSDQGWTVAETGYILVGAYTFDYGGLALESTGYLVAAQDMPGGRYVFTGIDGEGIDLRARWMWGHSTSFGEFTFFGHGEVPAGGGRRAFPDLAWRWAHEGRPEAQIARTMVELGQILVAFARRPQLSAPCGLGEAGLADQLALLHELGYVACRGTNWRSLCPVVDEPARAAVRDMVDKLWAHLLRQAVSPRWGDLERTYLTTAPARNGVPLPVAFNALHHLVFDGALRKLMERGTITCPPRRRDGAAYALWVEWEGRFR
ncbi:MAG: winged helix-turn-helix domain-containing protein [Candidatus Acetothermia bacterium]|nr:winged helix-turn-helix domain-containing protein [Candidatus Acetothermia bacterium]